MNFKELSEMQTKYLKEIETNGKEMLKSAFSEFFNENPLAHSIRWRQYTPYFNDGDECTFSVHDFEVALNALEDLEGGDYDDRYFNSWSLKRDDKYLDENLKDISLEDRVKLSENLSNFNELFTKHDELMRLTFGNHVVVTASREGFDVEGYNHD